MTKLGFWQSIKATPLALLVSLIILLRIPSLFEPYWYGDEGIYLTLGEAVRRGMVLYKDIFDHKPPAIYLIAGLAGSLVWLKFILLVWHTTTVVLFWKLAEKLLQSKKSVLAASVVFALLTTLPLIEGNIANSELFMAGPTLAALLLVFSKRPATKNLFIAGILFSISMLFKVPAVFDFLALCFFWLLSAGKKGVTHTAKNILTVGLGIVLPLLISVVYFWSKSALLEYIQTAWSQNFTYISHWTTPTLSSTDAADVGLMLRTVIFGLVLTGILLWRKRFDQTTLFASLWFAFALFASLISGRPYPHYIIQVVPPAALLLAILAFGKKHLRFIPVPLFLILTASLVFYKFYYYPTASYYQNFITFALGRKTKWEYFENFDKKTPTVYKLAQALSLGTSKNDNVLILGTAPELYALARRLPPGRYTTSFHIRDFGGQEETAEAVRRKNPKYIIILGSEQTEKLLPGVNALLEQNYIFLESVQDARVWKLVSPNIKKALQKL